MAKEKGKLCSVLILILTVIPVSGCINSGSDTTQNTLTVSVDHDLNSDPQIEVYDAGEMISSKEGDLVQFKLNNGNYTIKIYNNSITKTRNIVIDGSNERIDINLSDSSNPGDDWDPGQGWTLAWQDEFDNVTIDSSNWTRQVLPAGTFNNEWQRYTDSTENAYVEMDTDGNDGEMVIEAKYNDEGLGLGNFTSARMITNEKVEYKYGKIAARIKVPEGQGIWPAFWMLGTNISETGGDTPWPYCGEIDIMEKVGGNDEKEKTVHGTVHYQADNGYNYIGGSKTISEYLSADYHVYEIEWDAEEIIWKLDGVQYHSLDISGSEFDEFREEFYILLNVAVGGNWPGYPDATTEFPQKMRVDWVRVYKQ